MNTNTMNQTKTFIQKRPYVKVKQRPIKRLTKAAGYTAQLLICLLLINCGAGNLKSTTEAPKANSKDSITATLNNAKTAQGNEQIELLLSAIHTMLRINERDWARNTLSQIKPATLNPQHHTEYSIIAAKLTQLDGKHYETKYILWNARFIANLANASPEMQTEAYELRATTLFNIGDFHASTHERIKLDALLNTNIDQQELNQDLIWQTLMQIPQVELEAYSNIESGLVTQGWYRLAALSKNNQSNLRRQMAAVDDWQVRWPEHPANTRLPADLQLLKQLISSQPQNIALLLPVTGNLANAAQAIQDGLMAAFYQSAQAGELQPEINIYDTHNNHTLDVYQRAIDNGAELVIGPLSKEKIAELSFVKALPVPTLALNYLEQTAIEQAEVEPSELGMIEVEQKLTPQPQEPSVDTETNVDAEALQNPISSIAPLTPPENLYQFGLAVEDEAHQVAEQAFIDGHRRALIVAPQNTWGNRSSSAFTERWLSMGGEIIYDYRFRSQKDYSKLIKEAVGVTESEKRARSIRNLLGKNVEFEPRRRQDIDLIFLVARPSEARQIKPTLAFHYAKKIPVYATSHIYNGESNTRANQDMNAIRFTSMPWFFADGIAEKNAIDAFAQPSATYQRLYALGVDAFHIYPRLKQLEQVAESHYYGVTGTLRLDNIRRIQRKLMWANFISGNAFSIATVKDDSDDKTQE